MWGRTQKMLDEAIKHEAKVVIIVTTTYVQATEMADRLMNNGNYRGKEALIRYTRHPLTIHQGSKKIIFVPTTSENALQRLQGWYGAHMFVDHYVWETIPLGEAAVLRNLQMQVNEFRPEPAPVEPAVEEVTWGDIRSGLRAALIEQGYKWLEADRIARKTIERFTLPPKAK